MITHERSLPTSTTPVAEPGNSSTTATAPTTKNHVYSSEFKVEWISAIIDTWLIHTLITMIEQAFV